MLLSRLAVLPAATILLSLPAAAGTWTGRLVSDGVAVAGAVVSAVPHESPLDAARRESRGGEAPKPAATATTAPDGTFALTVPSTGKETFFRVRLVAKGFVAAELPGAFEAAETEDLGELALLRGGPLAGRVVGPGGTPVPGARVSLTPRSRPGEPANLAPVRLSTTTGPDGSFRFDAAGTGRNALLVEAAGFATQGAEAPKGGALRSSIALAPGSTLTGSVKRRDGKPAPGAVIRFEEGDFATRWVEAGADGAFRLDGLPSRKGRVVADAGDDGWAESGAVAPGASAPAVALSLAPPACLEGKTLNAETLRPVPRVKLTFRVAGTTRVERSAPDGKYRVRGLRPGEVEVTADEPRHVSWVRDGVKLSRGETKLLDVPLTLGATLTGRVVDESGRPVAEAKGSVGRSLGGVAGFLAGLRGGKPAFRTRADGTFTAGRLAPGESQNVAVTHPEYERSVLGGVALAPGGTKAGLVFTLRRGVAIAGSVRDAEGKPIPGAEIALSQSLTVRASRGGNRAVMNVLGGAPDAPRGKSGADGRFELHGVAPGDYTLRVKATGWATEAVDPVKVTRDAAVPPVDFVLAPGAAISGTVLRRTGGGVEGAFVLARVQGAPAAPARPGLDNLATGPDGSFVLDGLRAGATYDLQLFLGGGLGPGPAQKGVLAPSDGVEIAVAGTGRIEGSAVDAKTGQPLAAFDVSYEPERGGGMAFRVARRAGVGASGAGQRLHVESEDGRFALEDVPAGKWSVVVEAKGYQVARAGGVAVEEATTTDGVEVKVPPGTVLRGRVTDAKSGRPVVEANVVATSAAAPGAFPGLAGLDAGGLLTDADGRFEVEGLAPGKVSLRVDHVDYEDRSETVELKEGGSSVEVALSRGGSLGGTVLTASRQPAAGADVTLQVSGEGGFARGPFGGGSQSAVTDASGRFRFDHLSAGRYSASAQLSGQSSEPQSAVLTVGESNEGLVLVLAGGATLRGLVSGLPDAQRAGVVVSANGPQQYSASARTGSDGRFELTGLPSGTTSLRATAGDFLSGATRSASGSVTIADGQLEADATIVFEGTAALSGTVTRGGRPVSGAMVFAGPRRGGANASARTDDSGAFRMEGLEDGDYNASVQPPAGSGGRGVSKTVSVSGETTVDFEFPTASLSGVVVAAGTKQPLEGVRVTATLQGGGTTDGGRRLGGASTDTNGRWFLDDVEPGSWDLVFRREGYLEETRSASASETGGDGGSVELTRGEGLELQARDGIYQIPLRGVSVRVRDAAGGNVLATYVPLDGDGKGEVPSLKPGRYALVVESNGYAAQRFDGVVVPGSPLPVALTPGGAVELRAGEVSRGKGSATLRDVSGQPHPLHAFGEDGKVFLPGSGVATLSNVAPGAYTIAVEGVAPKGFTVTEGGRTVVELP